MMSPRLVVAVLVGWLFVGLLSFTPLSAQQTGSYLELSGNGQVVFPHIAAMQTGGTVTIEGWVRADANVDQYLCIFQRYQGGGEHKSLKVLSDGRIEAMYAWSPYGHATAAGVFAFDMQWHHVAFVRRGGAGYSIYYDGAEVLAGSTSSAVISATPSSQVAFSPITQGMYAVDNIRVSTVARYNSTFTPQVGWLADADTVLLLPFDEGSGNTVADASSYGQVGAITGTISWGSFTSVASSASVYGVGCGAPALSLTPQGSPILGGLATARIDNVPAVPGFPVPLGGITLGFSDTFYGGLPILPISLAGAGMPGCELLHSNDVFGLPVAFGSSPGTWDFSLPIPANANLLNTHVYLQAFAGAPGYNAAQFIVSNGVDWLIGNQ